MKNETGRKYIAYFDGACEPNPGGTVAYGVIISKDGEVIWQSADIYEPEPGLKGQTTNNVGEYAALIVVLQWLAEQKLFEADITVRGDSKPVIEQMFGDWKIKGGAYVALARQAYGLTQRFRKIAGEWIQRDLNTVADGLCQEALKRAGVKSKFKNGKPARAPANDNASYEGKLTAKAE